MGKTVKLSKIFAVCFVVYWLLLPVWSYSQRALRRDSTVREYVSKKLITEAEKYLYVREETGNNDGPEIKKFLKVCGLPEGYAWCAAFQAYIHDRCEIPAPTSARVVDWFKVNLIWKKEFGKMPFSAKPGMVGALYYQNLGRYGHIVLIVGQDANNFYTIEGNTNKAGSREGDGVYKKIRSKKSIAAISDYCLNGNSFIRAYDEYLQRAYKTN